MIAHLDIDAFFASVLVRKDPRLRGKPLLALGMGGGCVIAASYEAKAFGVKTGMPLKEAMRLAPNALQIQSDFHEAAMASREIESILAEQCPVIEQMSIDEWFLGLPSLVGGVPKDALRWATDTQQAIIRRTALTLSVGVGPTKTLAKMASEYRKPAGVTVLGQSIGREAFLRDRPAAAIPGIGRKRVQETDRCGWRTAWDYTQAPPALLQKLFGKQGLELQLELQGTAVYGLESEEAPPKSVSRCRTFRPSRSRDLLWAHLLKHMEYIVRKMRRHDLMCRGISLWLREDAAHDYTFTGANASLPQPVHTTEALFPFIRSCFEDAWSSRKIYTQVGLALWRLAPRGAAQYSLFESPSVMEEDEAIQKSIDELHVRFGRNAITRGSALAVKSGTSQTFDLPIYD